MVKTITGGFTTSGDGAKELAGEALGLSKKSKKDIVKMTDEEQSMERKIVKLLADGKADKVIRDQTGCSNGQLQVIKMYLGDIKNKIKVEEEKAVIIDEETKEKGEDDVPPTTEGKKEDTRKVKRVPGIWDPLSPDKPPFVEVPIEEEEPAADVEDEKEDIDVAEEAVKEAKIDDTKGRESDKSVRKRIEALLNGPYKTHQEIADIAKVSRSYVSTVNSKLIGKK